MELVTPMDAMLRMPGVCGPRVEVPESTIRLQIKEVSRWLIWKLSRDEMPRILLALPIS